MTATKRVNVFTIIFLILITCYVFFTTSLFIKNDDPITTSTHKINTGYGYTLSIDNKIVIKQDFIPSIQNIQPFCTSDEAQKVANLVKDKLIKKEHPSVKLCELEQLNIHFNCIDLY